MSKELPPLDSGITLVMDVDSTTVNHETLTGFVDVACRNLEGEARREALNEVDRITELGMNNQINFSQSLDLRASVIRSIGATRGHVDEYVGRLLEEIEENPRRVLTPSFADNADWIQRNAEQIYFFSGGMDPMVRPILQATLNVDPSHIRTNNMIFDGEGPDARFVGFDKERLLHKDDGKAQQIRALRASGAITGLAVMLGDGSNDFNARQPDGGADMFVAFTEIKDRRWGGPEDGVDFVATSLPEAVHFVSTIGSIALELNPSRQSV